MSQSLQTGTHLLSIAQQFHWNAPRLPQRHLTFLISACV
jgi:hypothetical protein